MNDTPATQRKLLVYESHVGMQHFNSKSIWNSAVINRKCQRQQFSIVGPKQFQSNLYMYVPSKTQTTYNFTYSEHVFLEKPTSPDSRECDYLAHFLPMES